MPASIAAQKIEAVYVCKSCKAGFIFELDIEDHQQMTGHSDGFYRLPLD